MAVGTVATILRSPGTAVAKLLQRRLARSTLWIGLAVICSRGSVVLAMMCAARLLDIEAFGRLMIVQSTNMLFQGFFIAGFMVTAPKLIAELRQDDPVRTAEIIAILRILGLATGLASACLLVVFAPQIAGLMFGRPELGELLRITSVILVLMTWNEIQMSIINGFEAFHLHAVVAMIAAPAGFVVFVVMTWQGGLYGSVFGLMAMAALSAAASTWSVRRLCRRQRILSLWWSKSRDWLTVWRLALPAGLGGFVWAPALWSANALLVNSEDGLAQFGLFSLANQFFVAVMFLPNMLTTVLLPTFSRQLGAQQVDVARRLLLQSVLATGLLVAVMGAGISLLSPWIMSLYGDDYAGGWTVLTAMMLAAVVFAPQGAVGNLLSARGWMWARVIISGASGLVLVGVAFFSTSYGAMGLAAAYLLCYLTNGALTFVYAKRALGPQAQARGAAPPEQVCPPKDPD